MEFVTGEPKYVQVADEMRREIRDGELKVGDSVGDLFKLQHKYQCSWGTVCAAEQILVTEGILSEIRMGMPTVVIATPGKLPLGRLIKRLRENQRDLSEIIAGLESLRGEPQVPLFDHVFIVIMENHGYDEIIGSPDAPYINYLAARYGVAANYVSVAHPSLPNYLALTGGDTFGITTDCTDCYQNAPNLVVDRIAPSGRTWRAYMEAMPSPGYLGDDYPYMQKHNPFVYYDDLRTDPAQLASVVPFTQLAADLAAASTTPAFGWITPSMVHDMHDGTVAQGDAWLSSQIPVLLTSAAWTQQQSLLVITWDEDDNAPGNQVATLVIANGVPAGFHSTVAYNHYSLLRTIEAAWGLAPLTANDAGAAIMSDFFATP